jgi:hypothetical protein
VARGTILPVAHRTCDDPEVAVAVEQAIATLRERFARARVAQESRAAAVRARLQAMVAEELPPGVSGWLIGSLAWGGFGPRSDVDLVLGGATPAQACRLEVRLTQALVGRRPAAGGTASVVPRARGTARGPVAWRLIPRGGDPIPELSPARSTSSAPGVCSP